MFDIIRSTVYIDLGRVFTTGLDNITYSLFRNIVKKDLTSWVVSYKSVETSLDRKLELITAKFE